MKRHFLLSLLTLLTLVASAQGTAMHPEAVRDGDVILPVSGTDAVTAYYKYTSSDADRLVTFTLPSPVATVVASATVGDKIDSDLPNMQLPDFNTETTIVKCLAPKDEPVYLKITFPALTFAADAEWTVVKVSSEEYEVNYGLSCSDPIMLDDGAKFLPLTAQTDPPFMPVPVYTAYTVGEDGWLYLNFQPSVSLVEYASDCNGQFKRLKHEYITQNGKAVGAKAMMEVSEGESFIFRISGFNAVMMTASVENPEPGTSCDFPLDITTGEVAIPAEAGDYFYRITPEHEGCIELTSDASLADGYVGVMMDCNGTGSFTVYNYLHLRTWVWDRMEYLIHINKAHSTAEVEKFNVAIAEPQPYDDIELAETLVSGQTYRTPDFAGEYYYRVVAPDDKENTFKLTTLTTPEDSYTRVNLYNPADMSVSVAKGFDMSYKLSPGVEYLLKWTVFDVANPIAFRIAYDNGASVDETLADSTSIETIPGAVVVNGNGVLATVTDVAGRMAAQVLVNGSYTVHLAPGVYIVTTGDVTAKIMIR